MDLQIFGRSKPLSTLCITTRSFKSITIWICVFGVRGISEFELVVHLPIPAKHTSQLFIPWVAHLQPMCFGVVKPYPTACVVPRVCWHCHGVDLDVTLCNKPVDFEETEDPILISTSRLLGMWSTCGFKKRTWVTRQLNPHFRPFSLPRVHKYGNSLLKMSGLHIVWCVMKGTWREEMTYFHVDTLISIWSR